MRRRTERGFTLVELMVALVAGIAVAGAAYVLSQASLDVFRQEERMSAAQFSAAMGISRMAGDIQRAGFMMSPDIENDKAKACGSPDAAIGYSNLKAIKIFKGIANTPSPDVNASTYNGSTYAWDTEGKPDSIRIAGNMSTTEQFEFRQVAGNVVYIAMDRGSVQRTLREVKNGGPYLRDIFRKGRWVRLVDSNGRENYRRIDDTVAVNPSCPAVSGDCTAASETDMQIVLDQAPTTLADCGPGATRGLINPISIVEYWIGKPLASPAGFSPDALDLATPVTGQAAQTGDDGRTELIRTEILDNGTPARTPMPDWYAGAGSLAPGSEVVAEFAVDLTFAAKKRPKVVSPTALDFYDFGDDRIDWNGGAFKEPELYSSLLVRLSTRTRVPDREAPVLASPRSRFAVFDSANTSFGGTPAGTTSHFARVRTLSTEVSLPNLAGNQW